MHTMLPGDAESDDVGRQGWKTVAVADTKALRKKLGFDQFDVLGDDAILSIFSFVANGPLEEVSCSPGASELTHSLPEVSKLWQMLSEHDCLWKPAIIRSLEKEPNLWTEGLLKLVQCNKVWDSEHAGCENHESNESFLERIRQTLDNMAYKTIYRQVVTKHIRQILPVFYMPGHVMLGGSYRLHMFEPRYRFMVAELLKGYPDDAKRGGLTAAGGRPAPVFIHANTDPCAATSPACLVQLVRCTVSPRDGTADVMLLPVAYVWMERVWVRPRSGNLHYAQSIRMGHQATEHMHELVHRETLRSIVSRSNEENGIYGDYWSEDEDDDEDFEDAFDDDDEEEEYVWPF